MNSAVPAARTPPREQVLVQGRGWSVGEVVCTLGPGDRPFEEQHQTVNIGAVLSGTFQYRSPAGDALLYPGAFMLGNAGACFECGHEHGIGDRCLALRLDPAYFDEIAAGVVGSARYHFGIGMLPALRGLTPPIMQVRRQLDAADPIAAEEAVVGLVESVVVSLYGSPRILRRPPARDQHRLSAVLRYIEQNSRARLDLDTLAAMACMSKYHFLRTFRRTLGLTPHQFLIGCRLRRAADALRSGDAPVSAIALDEGFPDLSGFNALFRQTFGVSPRAFRRRGEGVAIRGRRAPLYSSTTL